MPEVSAVLLPVANAVRPLAATAGDATAFALAFADAVDAGEPAADPPSLATARQDIAAGGSGAPDAPDSSPARDAIITAALRDLAIGARARAPGEAATPAIAVDPRPAQAPRDDDRSSDDPPTLFHDEPEHDTAPDPAAAVPATPDPLPPVVVPVLAVVPLPASAPVVASAPPRGEPVSAPAAAPTAAPNPNGLRAEAVRADSAPPPVPDDSKAVAADPQPLQPPTAAASADRAPRLDPAFAVLTPAQARVARSGDDAPAAAPAALKQVNASTPVPVPLAATAPPPVPGNAPLPAARAFARALASTRPPAASEPADAAPAPVAVSASPAEIRAPIAAPSALDTRQDDWPQRLIDRAEAARDAQNAADTRIRLVPETLGKIDVTLRQEGTTLHVHFQADVPATRDLLADAQPRLAAAAEARGLRLGDASVDTGGGQQNSQRFTDARPAPQAARANRLASVDALERNTAPGGRIA